MMIVLHMFARDFSLTANTRCERGRNKNIKKCWSTGFLSTSEIKGMHQGISLGWISILMKVRNPRTLYSTRTQERCHFVFNNPFD